MRLSIVRISLNLIATCIFLVRPAAAATQPLPLDQVSPATPDKFIGAVPSPDGEWAAFCVSRGEFVDLEYPTQRLTSTGFPLWAAADLLRTTLVNTRTGEMETLASARGVSWGGSWSPDSRRYAFYSDRSGSAALWIWDRATREVRQVSNLLTRNFRNTMAPAWTPDGRSIVSAVAPEGMTVADFRRFNPGFRALELKSSADTNAPTVKVYETATAGTVSELGWAMDYQFLADLALIDVESGTARRIARKVRSGHFLVSPDGRWLASLNVNDTVPNAQQVAASLVVYPLQDSGMRVLDANVIIGDPPRFSWSPDSSRIAYATQEMGKSHHLSTWGAYVVNVADGTRRFVSGPLGNPRLDRVAPLWDRTGTHIYLIDSAMPRTISHVSWTSKVGVVWEMAVDGSGARKVADIPDRSVQEIVSIPVTHQLWSPDGASILVGTRDDNSKKSGFFSVNVATGAFQPVAEFDADCLRYPQGAAGANREFYFFRESATQPVNLWALSALGQTRPVTTLNPEPASASQPRIIEWRSATGARLKGTVLLPPDFTEGRPCPLVVWVYAGSYGSDARNRFGLASDGPFNLQVLSTRGYAVLFPDIPLTPRNALADVSAAVLPALNRLIELGWVDPERMAVMGQSFGGYNTIGLITQTNRFKAAIACSAPAADQFEGYARFRNGITSIGYYEKGQPAMGDTPWSLPGNYYQNSPFFFLDRVQTPILIQRGATDFISDASGAVYNSLKRLGKEAVFLEYEREDHVLARSANIIDFWNRRLAFLAEHLDLAVDANGVVSPRNSAARPPKSTEVSPGAGSNSKGQ